MQMFRYAEQGSIGFFGSPAPTRRCRCPSWAGSGGSWPTSELFLVVQDAFLTETTALADVVLPAALWGEKTGTFTNADRTVHLSEEAVDPPGEARRTSTSGSTTPAGWIRDRAAGRCRPGHPRRLRRLARLLRGRPCDYTGLSYDKLARSGDPVALHRRAPRAPIASTPTTLRDPPRPLRGLRP